MQQHNTRQRFAIISASRFGSQHCRVVVNRTVSRSVCRAVLHGRHSDALGTLSSGVRAGALLLRNCAVGLRALGLYNSAHLLHNSPFGRSLSSLRALAKSLPGSVLLLQSLSPAASARLKSSRGFEAARSAPDWRPIPSLRSVISQAASRARFALDSAPHQSRLGTLLPLSLAGARSCFCRDRISQRWGASFTLLRLGASHHGSPTLGGLRKLSLWEAKSFWRCLQSVCDLRVWLDSAPTKSLQPERMGCERSPIQTSNDPAHVSQLRFNHLPCTTNPEIRS